jgi:hypothetical protein
MKKIIAWSVLGCVLFTSGAFADYKKPMLISAPIEIISENPVKDIIREHEVIIRNNIIKTDYQYNNSHYYTSKITTENIVIPTKIKEKAEKIYFLVEQGNNRIYYAKDSMEMSDESIEEVNDQYNYKIVNFTEGKKEYTFNNEDLVKEFWEDKYLNVNITLIAEFNESEKIEISNTVYVNIWNKENTLQNVYNTSKDKENSYFGYYNTNDLEIYLEEIADTMTRSEYKKLLSKADTRIDSAVTKNNKVLEDVLKSIKKDSDFAKYTSKYKNYSETRTLLSNLGSAVKNQLKNIRAFDAIDAILK